MKRLFAGILCLLVMVCLLPTAVFAATTIDSLTLIDVPNPRPGNPIPPSASVDTQGAELDSVFWYDVTAGKFVYGGSDYFIQDHVYRVELWVAAKDGYEFRYIDSRTPNVTATVNGKTADVTKAYEYAPWAMVVVSYTFEPCAKKVIQSVNVQLDGLTKNGNVLCAQEGKGIPFSLFSVSDDIALYPQLNLNRYYPYGFRWNDITSDVLQYSGDRFKGGHEYYVHIAIAPVGASFTDDLTVTINGKKATIKSKGADYAEVGIEVTCYGSIYSHHLTPVVVLPKAGNTPDYGTPTLSAACVEYAYVSGWYDVETGKQLTSKDTFVGGKQYRVEITCMAAYPYQFAKNANGQLENQPYITGQIVDSYSFGYDDYRGRELIYLTKTFTATGGSDAHTHTPSQWLTTGAYHYKTCTSCGDFLDQEDHVGGAATCTAEGTCTVCGYAYLETTENHIPDTSKWTACGNLYHAHLCKLCGAHCDAQDHTPGPEATEATAQTCTVCGYVIQPAKNHIHELQYMPYVAATCLATGTVEHYACISCNALFADKEGVKRLPEGTNVIIPYLVHETSDNWGTDEEFHWRSCRLCQTFLDETKMVHEIKNGKCTSCGYEIVADVTAPTEEPAVETPQKKNDWLPILLVALVSFAAAITVTVILLKKKKK